ncbi:MAG: hypothetical protein IKE42_06365 [Aquamicrobium sp.]|uniref:hypothetical protein n=1 Tax=Mesorhizobium sp. Pch-S TaxID=2082387 RepID=UPI0010117751|nr:hypothetical protein [Mesorhizobium sp. Pch-S]MBR2687458.1 hypothetical protein [Aquamicrobium sp.]
MPIVRRVLVGHGTSSRCRGDDLDAVVCGLVSDIQDAGLIVNYFVDNFVFIGRQSAECRALWTFDGATQRIVVGGKPRLVGALHPIQILCIDNIRPADRGRQQLNPLREMLRAIRRAWI